MTMDMDERWVNRSPQAMLETFHWFRGEGFSMIIEDILRLPMFTHRLYKEARRLELNAIEVDTTMTVDDLARRVTESFGL